MRHLQALVAHDTDVGAVGPDPFVIHEAQGGIVFPWRNALKWPPDQRFAEVVEVLWHPFVVQGV